MQIRLARPNDREALLAISLQTGDAGRDATPLHEDGRLVGLIYSVPYLELEPELMLVAEDEVGVAGFAVGSADTRRLEAQMERVWWPPLRAAHPLPEGDAALWNADQRRIARFHEPRITPESVVARYPAHLHLNLLPRAQGRGIGRRLQDAWLHRLRDTSMNSANRVHVGVHPKNESGLAFWTACGFSRIESPEARSDTVTVWLGKILDGGA